MRKLINGKREQISYLYQSLKERLLRDYERNETVTKLDWLATSLLTSYVRYDTTGLGL